MVGLGTSRLANFSFNEMFLMVVFRTRVLINGFLVIFGHVFSTYKEHFLNFLAVVAKGWSDRVWLLGSWQVVFF